MTCRQGSGNSCDDGMARSAVHIFVGVYLFEMMKPIILQAACLGMNQQVMPHACIFLNKNNIIVVCWPVRHSSSAQILG
jgi:hypothetical protein